MTTDICKQTLANWMLDNESTLANHPRRDFGEKDGVYVNWYISGKKPSAWRRRASGTYKGKKFRAFTRSGDADMTMVPLADLKQSPEKFWVVWMLDKDTVDKIEWMTEEQLAAIGGKDTFKKKSYQLDWFW